MKSEETETGAPCTLPPSVGHELKTPLTAIQMCLHMLPEDPGGPLTAAQKDLLRMAAEEADRLNTMIGRLVTREGHSGRP